MGLTRRSCFAAAAALACAGCGSGTRRHAFTCPASLGHVVATPLYGKGVLLGDGPVLLDVDNAGDPRPGTFVLGRTDVDGWLALKTHFVARPSYRGGFTVRARRLDLVGPAELGTVPAAALLVVPAGPSANTKAGWREVPDPTWVKAPGCYAWTIAGSSFRERIVVRALRPAG